MKKKRGRKRKPKEETELVEKVQKKRGRKPKIKDLVWLNLRLAVVSFLRKVYPEMLLI